MKHNTCLIKIVKIMKRSFFLMIIVAIALLFTYSCEPDASGENKTDVVNEISVKWNCVENSATFGQQTFDVDIARDAADSSKIYMTNFAQVNGSVYATVNNMNITIPAQTIADRVYKGSGIISSSFKSISFSYTINDGNDDEAYTAELTEYKVPVKKIKLLK